MARPAMGADDRCAQQSTATDVQFSIALKDHAPVFQAGEIIPLRLSFSSSAQGRYRAINRIWDAGGRIDDELYCAEPQAPDPLEYYFHNFHERGGSIHTVALEAQPFHTDVELNEWRNFRPGHYRVYAISSRVYRYLNPAPPNLPPECVRSNTIEIDVTPADPKWQSDQLQGALQVLAEHASSEPVNQAERVLRFLNSPDSVRELARRSSTASQNLVLGLFGSTMPQLAIDALRAEFAAPDRPATAWLLLAQLQLSREAAWNPPRDRALKQNVAFWSDREQHLRDLTKKEIAGVVEALPHKIGPARALTLRALLNEGDRDPSLVGWVRAALIEAWGDLPASQQEDLIHSRWSLIASPAMTPILRKLLASPATDTSLREMALYRLWQLEPAEGSSARSPIRPCRTKTETRDPAGGGGARKGRSRVSSSDRTGKRAADRLRGDGSLCRKRLAGEDESGIRPAVGRVALRIACGGAPLFPASGS